MILLLSYPQHRPKSEHVPWADPARTEPGKTLSIGRPYFRAATSLINSLMGFLLYRGPKVVLGPLFPTWTGDIL